MADLLLKFLPLLLAQLLFLLLHVHNLVMLKTQPLCTSAKWNLGNRVLGKVEKNSFIALPGKGGHSRLMPQKLCPNPGEFSE